MLLRRYLAAPLAAVTLFSQTPSQQPLIRVSTHLVEVSVVVRDKSGPVAGLTAADFSLFDQNKPQKIATFAVNSLQPPPGAPAGTPPAVAKARDPLPPNVYSNRPETKASVPANTVVILLDGLNTVIRDQQYARQQFLGFLKQLKPTDRVAIYALNSKLTVFHEFTNDSARLLESVTRYSGENSHSLAASSATGADTGEFVLDSWLNDSAGMAADRAFADRAHTTADALEAIANHIARLPGRKSLVWISGSFPLSIGHLGSDGVANWEDAAFDQQTASVPSGNKRTSASANTGSGSMSQSTALYGVNLRDGNPARAQASFMADLLRATKALSDADIAVYPVDARGLIVLPKSMTAEGNAYVSRDSVNQRPVSESVIPTGHNSMQVVAENTGGRVFENTNDIHGAIRSAIDDSEIVYTLGFYPSAGAMDGKFHALKVQVKRPGAETRFRRGYLATADAAPVNAAAAMRETFASPIEATGITLTAGIEKTDKPKAGTISLTVAIEPRDVAFSESGGKWNATLDLGFNVVAADGADLNTSSQAMNLHLTREQYDAVLQQGMTVTKNIDPKPGMWEIRVGVVDRSSGRSGSIFVPVH
jgi:VWFA-related protein